MSGGVKIAAAAVAVATTDIVMDIPVEDYDEAGFAIKNTGLNPIDAFEIHVRMQPSGELISIASSAGDYSSPAYPLRKVIGAFTTLAAGAVGMILLNVSGFNSLVFKASSGTGTTTLKIEGNLN